MARLFYGYTTDELGRLVIDENQAAIVRAVLTARKGSRAMRVATLLRSFGIDAPKNTVISLVHRCLKHRQYYKEGRCDRVHEPNPSLRII